MSVIFKYAMLPVICLTIFLSGVTTAAAEVKQETFKKGVTNMQGVAGEAKYQKKQIPANAPRMKEGRISNNGSSNQNSVSERVKAEARKVSDGSDLN